jgi:cell wall-associated NlpC family hydrolase
LKDIKVKPTNIKPKILETVSNIPKDAKSVMKEQLINQAENLKPEFKDKSQENATDYATGKIESGTQTAVNKTIIVADKAKDFTVRKIMEHRADKAIKTADTSTPEMHNNLLSENTAASEQRTNAPKTRESIQQNQTDKSAPNTQQKQAENIKIRENVSKENHSAKSDMHIKTKENYLKSQGKSQVTEIDTAPKALDNTVKSKQANIRTRSADNKSVIASISDSDTARKIKSKEYVMKKQERKKALDRAEAEKSEIQANSAITDKARTSDGIQTDTEIKKTAESKIKTKEQYRHSQNGGNSQKLIKTKEADIKNFDRIEFERNRLKSMPTHKISAEKTVTSNTRIKQRTIQKNNIKIRGSKSGTYAADTAKKVKGIKTSKKIVKKANPAKIAQKKATAAARKKAAKKAAQETAKRTAQAAKATARVIKYVAVKVAQAVAAAAKAVASAIAALGGWAVLLILLIIVIIVAAIAASPFGIFISEEVNEVGAIPLSQIIAEYNVELTQQVEDIELSVDHTDVEIIDNQTDRNIVLAVFAAKTAGAEDNTAADVVIFDDVKAENLKAYFRAANTVNYTVTESTNANNEIVKKLTVTISGKTKDELMDLYGLTAKQREAVETLLEHGDVLTSSSHSLAITNADVQSIINGLPSSLPQKRKEVVKNAGSLVGKVNYFWGGKSSAIGWDSAWGTMRRVTAAGSPSSGTLRAYGLDCSGFVTWAFNNSGMGYAVGHGTYGQHDASVQVTASTVQAGDLCFLPSYSHVGIVVGKDTSGNILVIHCSSGANNVVVSTASSVGFTVFRRPNCY